VLPDWDCDHLEKGDSARGGWMVIDEDGPSLFDLDRAEPSTRPMFWGTALLHSVINSLR
jgi:hypothetical protein